MVSYLGHLQSMLKYVNTSVVFQEIPDEVTLAINLANCPCRCPGCHSSYLWQDLGCPLTAEALDQLIAETKCDITCVCLMGGDADPAAVNRAARYIRCHHAAYKVGWYSGRMRISDAIDKDNFDYIKIGPYIRHLGTLKDRTTNQKMYKCLKNGKLEDITPIFWRD